MFFPENAFVSFKETKAFSGKNKLGPSWQWHQTAEGLHSHPKKKNRSVARAAAQVTICAGAVSESVGSLEPCHTNFVETHSGVDFSKGCDSDIWAVGIQMPSTRDSTGDTVHHLARDSYTALDG